MIDLSPFWQTFLTLAAIVGIGGLVIAGEVGRLLVKRDPASVWGPRLVMGGIVVRAVVRSKAVEVLAPVQVRALLVSLTESEPPAADPDATPVGTRKDGRQ